MVDQLAQTTSTAAVAKPFDWRPTIVIALVVLACAFVWWQWFMTYHLEVVQDGVLYDLQVKAGKRRLVKLANQAIKAGPR